jgi:hypothetical protein
MVPSSFVSIRTLVETLPKHLQMSGPSAVYVWLSVGLSTSLSSIQSAMTMWVITGRIRKPRRRPLSRSIKREEVK